MTIFGAFAQFGLIVDDGFGIHAHAGALTGRFDEEREVQFRTQGFVTECKFLEWSNRQVAVAPETFRQRLIQGNGIGQDA